MSLTTTAKNTKLAFKLFLVFVVVYLLGKYFLFPVAKKTYLSFFPPKNPPNPIFGLLDPIEFIEQETLGGVPVYSLLTKGGKLPEELPNRAKVYKYLPYPFSYSAGKLASRDASILGFSDELLSTNLKGDEYRWTDPKTGATLAINITTKDLEMKVPGHSLISAYNPGSINRITAPTIAKSLLQGIGRFSDPLYINGSQNVELGVVRNGKIVYTSFQGEAEVARIDFFRSINNFPIVGPVHREGLIRMIVGVPENTEDKELNGAIIKKSPYIYYKVRGIEPVSQAIYPLLPVSIAWSEVAKGNGVISRIKPANQSVFEEYQPVEISEILITDIYLAYYDSVQNQPYLQPVYVFEGNYIGPGNTKGSISVYYPAISGEYIKQESPNNAVQK